MTTSSNSESLQGAPAAPNEGAVVLLFGPVTVRTLTGYSNLLGDSGVLDTNVARMAGATMAMGSKATLDHMREQLGPACIEQTRRQHASLSNEAVRWLACGDRGTSSETIFQTLTGIVILEAHQLSHPRDAGDFWRCRMLLDQVPELGLRISEMSAISDEWASLVSRWEEICQAMDQDTQGLWRDGHVAGEKTSELVGQCVRAPKVPLKAST